MGHTVSAAAAIALAAALVLAACDNARNPGVASEALYLARDYVGDGVFTAGIEGPAMGPDGALYVVNFGREGTIGRVTPQADGTGLAELFVELPDGSIGNGIRFGADGLMYVADYRGHRILRIDPEERRIEVFAELPQAHQPNDLATVASGWFYASDPDWANDSGQLWQIAPSGEVRLIASGLGTTNGIELSANMERLYVGESAQRRVWTYLLGSEGQIAGKRLLIEFPDHGLDGIRSDNQGNLYIARYGAGSVAIVSPEGELLREVRLKGQKPTNLAFGGEDGRTVFVTLQDRGAIETFRSEFPGREAGR